MKSSKDGIERSGEPHFAAAELADPAVALIEFGDLLILGSKGTHDAHGVHVLLHIEIDRRIPLADGGKQLPRTF